MATRRKKALEVMTESMASRVDRLIELKKQLKAWQWQERIRYGFWVHPFAKAFSGVRIRFNPTGVVMEKKMGPKDWVVLESTSFSKLDPAAFLDSLQSISIGREQNATPAQPGPIAETK